MAVSSSRSATEACSSTLWIGGGGEPELDHRAMILDVAGVGGPAIGRERGRETGDLAHRLAEQGIERPRLGEKGIARRLELDARGEVRAGQRDRRLLAQLRLQRVRRVPVVVAHVEARLGGCRDHVYGGVADVDAGHFEIGRREMRAAVIERGVVEAGEIFTRPLTGLLARWG